MHHVVIAHNNLHQSRVADSCLLRPLHLLNVQLLANHGQVKENRDYTTHYVLLVLFCDRRISDNQ